MTLEKDRWLGGIRVWRRLRPMANGAPASRSNVVQIATRGSHGSGYTPYGRRGVTSTRREYEGVPTSGGGEHVVNKEKQTSQQHH